MTEQHKKLNELLKLLEVTSDDEIDCDEFWKKAAWLAELDVTLNAKQAEAYFHHLKICSGCKEDFALLHGIVIETRQDPESVD